MPNPQQLPSLLKLLDDDSPAVRRAVTRQLTAFGAELEDELRRMPEPIDIELEAQRALARILADNHRAWFRSRWLECFKLPAEAEQLEAAQALIADFQNGRHHPKKLGAVLDRLADECRAADHHRDPILLARFLFEKRGLTGARDDYYGVPNSNLVWVAEHGSGLPISLACIYILVGQRLGLEVDGCNFPGHFLGRARVDGRIVLVDCFEGGKIIETQQLLDKNPDATDAITTLIENPPPAAVIMARVLRNLIRSYQEAHEDANRQLTESLLKEMVAAR